MQDDTKDAPGPDTKPASHDQTNGSGMTNGVPDQIQDGESKGRPPNGREESETIAADPKP